MSVQFYFPFGVQESNTQTQPDVFHTCSTPVLSSCPSPCFLLRPHLYTVHLPPLGQLQSKHILCWKVPLVLGQKSKQMHLSPGPDVRLGVLRSVPSPPCPRSTCRKLRSASIKLRPFYGRICLNGHREPPHTHLHFKKVMAEGTYKYSCQMAGPG